MCVRWRGKQLIYLPWNSGSCLETEGMWVLIILGFYYIGWILRTFTTRDSITMMTLFKSLVLPILDYGSQLWSPHLVKHIDQIEKIQRSFTKHITGLHGLEYSERLVA